MTMTVFFAYAWFKAFHDFFGMTTNYPIMLTVQVIKVTSSD